MQKRNEVLFGGWGLFFIIKSKIKKYDKFDD